jgi:hypothetical protein
MRDVQNGPLDAMAINPPAATRHLHMHVYLAGTQLY